MSDTTVEHGFKSMIGKQVTLFCGIYFYTGRLEGVHDEAEGLHLELIEPMIVYETGDLTSGPWKNAQKLPSPWRVMVQGIESWGPAKCR